MKTNKRFLVMMVASLLMATSVWAAGTVTVIKKLNGTVNNDAGTVTSSVSNNVCTLTVTPATGNYATVEGITAERVVDAGMAQAPRRAGDTPDISNAIDVTATSTTADPSGETTYTFTMPGADYDVEVTVDFKSRTAITGATITLAQTSFTYDGEAKEPAVSSVVLSSTTLTSSDYRVAYSNNVAAGTATVTVTGQRTYTGTATTTFTIGKAQLSDLQVFIEGWTYGAYSAEVNAPRTEGNAGEGTETFTYKAKNEETFSATVPTNAGDYVVKVSVAETDNYAAGEATAEFAIAKAQLANVSVSLTGWTYGDAANTPTVNGNLGSGAVTYTYANTAAPSLNYTSDVPTNAGSYSVKAVIAETTNYEGAEATSNFTIAQADFSQVVIADIADQNFTGSAIEPTVTVTFKGNAVDASEYTVAYSNNINKGQATVTLTTANVNFAAGETNPTKTFQIIAALAVITGTDQSVTYNRSAQDYTNGSVDKGTLVVTYYDSEDDRAKGSNGYTQAPTNAAVYYVQLTQGDDNYTSQPVDVTFTINAKSVTSEMFSIPEDDEEVIYEGQAITPEVSGWDSEDELTNNDFEVAYSNNKVGTATITVTGKGNYQGQVVINFAILRQLNVTFAQNTWASYSAAENLQIPAGLKAYVVSGVQGNTVSVSEVNYLPQGVGVLLNATEPADSYVAAAYEGVPEQVESELVGCATATAVTGLTAENDIYVLYNDEFVKSTAGTIPAGRSYLPLAKGQATGGRLTISFDDEETTGIARVNGESVATDGAIYTLNGVRVEKPTKGLYIVNGKKVVIK